MNNLQYRDHAVDIHSHIIPGADDGAQMENETADLIALDREEGMSVIFATPHYGMENGYDRNKITDEDEIMKNYKEMQLDQKEREKFELYLISNPFVTPGSIYITSRG